MFVITKYLDIMTQLRVLSIPIYVSTYHLMYLGIYVCTEPSNGPDPESEDRTVAG